MWISPHKVCFVQTSSVVPLHPSSLSCIILSRSCGFLYTRSFSVSIATGSFVEETYHLTELQPCPQESSPLSIYLLSPSLSVRTSTRSLHNSSLRHLLTRTAVCGPHHLLLYPTRSNHGRVARRNRHTPHHRQHQNDEGCFDRWILCYVQRERYFDQSQTGP